MTSALMLKRTIRGLQRKRDRTEDKFSIFIAHSKDAEYKEMGKWEADLDGGNHTIYIVPLYNFTGISQDYQLSTPQDQENTLSALGITQ